MHGSHCNCVLLFGVDETRIQHESARQCLVTGEPDVFNVLLDYSETSVSLQILRDTMVAKHLKTAVLQRMLL